jgi:hypothetical protein
MLKHALLHWFLEQMVTTYTLITWPVLCTCKPAVPAAAFSWSTLAPAVFMFG